MKNFGIVFLSFIIFSCHQQETLEDISLGNSPQVEDALSFDEAEMEAPRITEPPSPEFSLKKGSKIIKTGHMSFEVSDLEKSKKNIDALLSSTDSYYENEHYNEYANRISYSLQIRILNTKFDSVLIELENGMGVMKSKNINARDVTEEFVDLSIRLENKLAFLEQYQSILQRAKTIKEVLEVQEKIRRIEEEIESKKGRLKYLDDNVKYSSLNLEISELITKEIANKPHFGRRVVNAFNNGIQGFLSFIVAAINLWPLLLLILLFYLGWKPIMRKIRGKIHIK